MFYIVGQLVIEYRTDTGPRSANWFFPVPAYRPALLHDKFTEEMKEMQIKIRRNLFSGTCRLELHPDYVITITTKYSQSAVAGNIKVNDSSNSTSKLHTEN